MNIYTEPAAPATKTATDSTAPQGPSWRDILQIHPAAALFPRLSRDELRALGEDILENGQRVPIALWKERTELPPSLLDGIGRLDAMEAVGLHVEVNFFGSPQGPTHVCLYYWHPGGRTLIASTDIVGDDPHAYVISANIRRRHLSIEDKNRLIVQLLKADPTKSNRTVAKLTDTSHPHVAKVRKRAENVGDVETVTTSIDTKGRAQPATKPSRGKFTAEVIQQIKNLVERGVKRRHRREDRRHYRLVPKSMLAAWHRVAPEEDDHADTAAARRYPRRRRPGQHQRGRAAAIARQRAAGREAPA